MDGTATPPVRTQDSSALHVALAWAAAIAVPAACVFWFAKGSSWGLPLDDAWIHAAHARSLVETGALALQDGRPSAAVTSPLWTLLLALLYATLADPVQAAALLGLVTHTLLGAGAFALVRGAAGTAAGLAACFVASLTGPLLWHSLSGMETCLFVAGTLWALWAWAARRHVLAGVLAAAVVLTRIEGLLLLVPLLWDAVVEKQRRAWMGAAVVAAVTAAFCCWNLARVGALLPSTMEGKRWGYGISPDRGPAQIVRDAADFLVAWADYLPFGLGAHGWRWAGWLLGTGAVAGLAVCRKCRGIIGLILVSATLNAAYAALLPAQGAGGRYQALNWILCPVLAPPALAALGRLRLSRPAVVRSLTGSAMMRTAALAAAALLVAHSALNASAWAMSFRSHVDHIQAVHVAAAATTARANVDCRPLVAYDIGAIAWFARTPACHPRLFDLGGLEDASLVPLVREGTAVQTLTREHGPVFLSLPLTLSDDFLSPRVGLTLIGPPGSKTLTDPSGTLAFRLVAEYSIIPEDRNLWALVQNNAPEVAVWRVTTY